MSSFRFVCFFLGFALFFSSCGYHFGRGSISSVYNTISVPYVIGDVDGSLTATLIKEIEQYGGPSYVDGSGQLRLLVKVLDFRDQNIGFRYDRKRRGQLQHTIIPTETRIKVIAEVTLINSRTCNKVLGPLILSASVDFDHDYYSSRNGVNIFSLGQLDDIDAARDAVKVPLYKALAKKIVEYINESW